MNNIPDKGTLRIQHKKERKLSESYIKSFRKFKKKKIKMFDKEQCGLG